MERYSKLDFIATSFRSLVVGAVITSSVHANAGSFVIVLDVISHALNVCPVSIGVSDCAERCAPLFAVYVTRKS